MRVLVTGDRNWHSFEKIAQWLRQLPPDSVVIQGGCRGADEIASGVAKTLGLAVETYSADWVRYGRGAGPKRNQVMLDSGVDLILAFHSDLANSKGTADMVRRARKAGIPVEVIE